MTKEEYNKKKEEIKKECFDKLKAVEIEYAVSNNPVKLGDIITDHYHTIKVEDWNLTRINNYPSLIYKGVQYTKKGEVSKRQLDTIMYQSNMKTINGNDYKYEI